MWLGVGVQKEEEQGVFEEWEVGTEMKLLKVWSDPTLKNIL